MCGLPLYIILFICLFGSAGSLLLPGLSLVAVLGLLTRWLLLWQSTDSGAPAPVVETCELSSCGSRALKHKLNSCGHGLSCSAAACGIFPDQGSNPCILCNEPPGIQA